MMFEQHSWHRIAPFGAYVLFMLLEDALLVLLDWDANEVRLLYAVKITVVASLLWWFRSTYRELQWPAGSTMRTWIVAIAAGITVFIVWINLTADWMMMGGSVGFDPRENGEIDWSFVAIRLIGAVLVVPVMEELFWRSFLMRWLHRPNFLAVNPSQVGIKAFLITASLFAVAHNLWFAGLLAGVVYNLLYMRSGILWSPILAHAITNAILGIWIIATNNWDFW
ncbi:hypothetical protein W03_07130 [Nitrosomonas sp. PY1]|uniref:CAAX prenyl protease-related protein n=1 Tax=Nitrosomonas sp. PY1 TaxID=1803906 RepID=UPI001FC82387|nr:CAAX prenyl protease-related protein [Nitrosomonas sp. PY1]GKS68709.1 hypothetical protein W03_07130 [Nitrosomonas sp. PY1]